MGSSAFRAFEMGAYRRLENDWRTSFIRRLQMAERFKVGDQVEWNLSLAHPSKLLSEEIAEQEAAASRMKKPNATPAVHRRDMEGILHLWRPPRRMRQHQD
jgi:hypothetical protein